MPDGTSDRTITLELNGESRRLPIEDRALLVDVVRDTAGLTGSKVGCYGGDCGACTMELDGEIVKGCLVLAASADGAAIRTLEGVSENGRLDPVQQAFWDLDAFQCGFCVAGFVFAARDLLARTPDPSEDEIREAFIGNYCRCTGYVNFVSATQEAARRLREG